ncbi:MAG: MFS transporter [Deltaproteobacteria bacterium GWC2_42_51]|nr:MAG: MFS transporter [Deltaproteobacteria bacterium GWC2_42_51]OGP37734.1 MAG: MFS transporter [Deltaproteobacteria bacterium GWD2_42_10]OGP45784.1 MAG: MFS transporter [Deltaproteobacteria bacterium GWF2_42_12]OGQ28986.1 MAG: MFS transporter [Deltaproteobacteria bacterium RIFCSPHIGHO2_02_FULL_42_44]OGQ37952.1 MAG: MFS transporter [Deltaproteobacteria bacterium RIFCSPLOWO2_02_FULL_42_39]OGQ70342.1 MAG: MFS transporter [Deltaproteobacteria bacterium RIFCSPLOWO2_12_FULL_42_16]OGQ77057.1 MAG:
MAMKGFWKSGHPPTLLMAFLYFDVSFMVWMVNAAMAPFISQEFNLTPAQKGLMLSIPVFAGALLRIPLGLAAEIIGRKTAALIGLGGTILAMVYGFYLVNTYNQVLILGALLGVAGASFAVALPLGSGWFPPQYQGLAMGIAGAGNSGTVLAGLFAGPLAKTYGWQNVYGYFAIPVLVVMGLMWLLAKEPPDKVEHKKLTDYLKVLVEKDIWIFNLLYWVTFGGFVGFASFVPTFMADQYGVSKVVAGQFMIVVGFTASAVRIIGGWFSDRFGGINALTGIYIIIAGTALLCSTLPASITMIFVFLFLMSAGMGAGNGSVFQLIPLRFPHAKAITSGVVGEFGALGGAFIPLVMGYSQEYTGSFSMGFVVYAITAVAALSLMMIVQRRWTTSWVGKGGRALITEEQYRRVA